MPTISVIIPIYNVMNYLNFCIQSLVNQTFSDIEIICVDDCSTDNSNKIINEWIARDKRINLVKLKTNSGQSTARNAGLDFATGKYIYFIDADDWIATDYLESMLRMAEKSGSEMVINTDVLGVWDEEMRPLWRAALAEGEYWDNIKAINRKCYNVWSHFYKREFLERNGLRFPDGYIYEDSYFYHLVLSCLRRTFVFQGPAYYYRQRPGSTMDTVSHNPTLLRIQDLLLKFYKNNPHIDCTGIGSIDNRIVIKLSNDNQIREYRDFYKKNLPYILRRGFYIDDYEKFLLKCLFASANLAELQERISQNKRFSFLESATFFLLLLRNSKSTAQQKYFLFAKQLLWKSIKDYLNPYIPPHSKIRKAYRTLRNTIKRTRS